MTGRWRDALDQLGRSDLGFTLALLALRSVLRPYLGFHHDAQLYLLQVLNRVRDGFHSEDLFFLFGSQDSYSLFSPVLAPVAGAVGLPAAFLCGYLASMALLVFAEVRLVRRLIPDPLLGNVALVLLVVSDLPYGGCGIFHVHESFLTARLPAQALVLLGFCSLLDGRWRLGVVCLAGAMLIHPLVGVSGLCVAIGMAGLSSLRSGMPQVTKTTVGNALCGVPRRANRIATPADSAERHRGRSLQNPGYLGIAAIAGVGLLLSSSVVGGLFETMDEPWMTAVMRRSPQCFLTLWTAADWIRTAAAFSIAALGCRWLNSAGRGLVLVISLVAVGGVIVTGVAESTGNAFLLQGQAYRALWLVQWLAVPIGVLSVGRLFRCEWRPSIRNGAAAGLLIAALLLSARPALPVLRSPCDRDRLQHGHRDLQFVANVIGLPEDRHPSCVYWPMTPPAMIWIDLQANCYFDLSQVTGMIFSRDLALESVRRSTLVKRFEVARQKKIVDRADVWETHLSYLGATFEESAPTTDDLLRLAGEDRIDWVILDRPFGDLHTATNGSVYIYDCRKLRNRLAE